MSSIGLLSSINREAQSFKALKYVVYTLVHTYPLFRTKHSILLPSLGQRKCTLFRKDLRENVYPVLDRLAQNDIPCLGQRGRKP